MYDSKVTIFIFIFLCISTSYSLPMTRMRVCVQSNDPTRLPSQCVFCNNRLFPATVRQCTTNVYLPASLSVEEGFCMVKNCRRQMPMMRPEPFISQNIPTNIPNSLNNVNTDEDYSDSEALYADTPTNGNKNKRPAAPISVGRPQRPQRPGLASLIRPFMFGKRSVDSNIRHQMITYYSNVV